MRTMLMKTGSYMAARSAMKRRKERDGAMPALSFQGEWLDKLLSGNKRQTTRKLTDRFKVGDVVHIYNQQRRSITDKPERSLTVSGFERMHNRNYPGVPKYLNAHYYAHFLGKVVITGVYTVPPSGISFDDTWAKADGFTNFACADTWFTQRYGENWSTRPWTVIRWNGWLERYFEPGAVG